MPNPILVTGATGNVGRHVVSELLAAGASVRALTRDPTSARLPDGVDIVRGDLTAPDTLEPALDGVDVVFLVWPLGTAYEAPPVLDAIARHARRIVYLSAMGVRHDRERQTDPITQFHADIERLIEASSLQWTFLRAGGFATNTLQWAPQIRADGVVRWPFANATRSLVHERDLAAVAARALTEEGHAGQRYILTGPEALTQAEQVRVIGEGIGRPLRFEDVPREEAAEWMRAAGWSPSLVAPVLEAWAGMAANPEPVTPTVQEITGAPARSLREWAIDHAADFR